MTTIKSAVAGTQHIHREAPIAKQPAIDHHRNAVIDQIERRRPGISLDPNEMRRHIDKVLDGPWGPIDARALYSAPVPGQPEIPRDARAMYGIDLPPHEDRPPLPDIQPLYSIGGGTTPDWPPVDIQPLYSIGDNPPWIGHEPSIRAMYGIDLGDQIYWPRKA